VSGFRLPAASSVVNPERMDLEPWEWARYYAPTAICVYLAVLCALLVVTSAFLVHLPDAVAVTAAGVFGLALSGGLGLVFWRAQRRDLLFVRVQTAFDAQANFNAVRAASTATGWRISREEPRQSLDAETVASPLGRGERVAVRFRGGDVLVASICDPGVGFSLSGRRRCARHRAVVLRAVGVDPDR
jgi:hypothetical protein